MSAIETQRTDTPAWLAEPKFCHLTKDGMAGAACGQSPPSSGWRLHADDLYWHGEAICSECGRSMCPRCVAMAALDDALESA